MILSSFVDGWATPLQVVAYIVGLALGVFCLVKFCDLFVGASSSIAKKLHISPLIIGLTIVAIGTSCPELAVSVSDSIAVLKDGGNANVALGNVVGSNICNLLIVIGFSAIFTPIIVKKSICKREFPFLLIISLMVTIFGCFFAFGTGSYAILRWEAAILCVCIPVYIGFLIYNAKKHPEDQVVEDVEEGKDMKMWLAIILVIVGAAGIIFGGQAVVFGAKGITLTIADAAKLNRDMAESLVGLTVVAVGTSLPELVTSVVAAKKGENEIALGNVIGSNIFNMVFVLGVAGVVSPLTSGSQIILDLVVMMVATITVFIFALRGKIGKKAGFTLILLYVAYVAYLVIRTLLTRG